MTVTAGCRILPVTEACITFKDQGSETAIAVLRMGDCQYLGPWRFGKKRADRELCEGGLKEAHLRNESSAGPVLGWQRCGGLDVGCTQWGGGCDTGKADFMIRVTPARESMSLGAET